MKVKIFVMTLLVIFSLLLGACTPQVEEAVEEVEEVVEEEAEEVVEEVEEVAEEVVEEVEEEVVEDAPAVPSEAYIAIGADPADLSPFVGNTMGRIAVLKTVYEYMFEPQKMGEPVEPLIAKGYEQTGDLAYEVTLFDYVYDSAGNHITAADVEWAYDTAIEGGLMRPLGSVESVTATGDYTVEFVFKAPPGVGDVDKVLTEVPVISKVAYEASPDKFATTPVTTAAYVLTDYIPASSLTFEARPDYWQTDPEFRSLFSQTNVQKIVFQVITEPAQHAIALETGSAHASASVTPDDVSRFEENPDYNVFKFRDNLTWAVSFNGSEGHPFTSKELRHAVAYAIDTDGMCQAIGCMRAYTIGNGNFGGYLTKWESEDYYNFDLAKAQDLLTQAGYEPGELTFKLIAQNSAGDAIVSQIIQNQLGELGINIEIEQMEPSTFNEKRYDPTAFDLVLNGGAGGDFIFSPWLLTMDQNRNNGTTGSFFKDDEMQSLLMTVSSVDGFTPENVDAFHQYQKEQLYDYGLLSYVNNVVSVKSITDVVRDTRGQLIPGAFVYGTDF